jgi:subtilisin family serine protease
MCLIAARSAARTAMSNSVLPAWSDAFTRPPVVPAGGLPVTAGWAFDDADGTGVRVGVVDSGIDHDNVRAVGPHADGVALHWDPERREVVTEAGPHEDLYGHGTACAAIIRRAAPQAELVSVRVLGSRLSGKGEVFAAGLRWATQNGLRVVNLSLSSSKADLISLFHEVADEAAHAGVVLVCAMNNVLARTYPSEFSSVISVAACEGDDPFLLLANPSPPADFAAPGLDLEVAWMDGGSITASGNSFAAPHIAGLAARLLSKHPHLTPYEVKAVLRTVAANVSA